MALIKLSFRYTNTIKINEIWNEILFIYSSFKSSTNLHECREWSASCSWVQTICPGALKIKLSLRRVVLPSTSDLSTETSKVSITPSFWAYRQSLDVGTFRSLPWLQLLLLLLLLLTCCQMTIFKLLLWLVLDCHGQCINLLLNASPNWNRNPIESDSKKASVRPKNKRHLTLDKRFDFMHSYSQIF